MYVLLGLVYLAENEALFYSKVILSSCAKHTKHIL